MNKSIKYLYTLFCALALCTGLRIEAREADYTIESQSQVMEVAASIPMTGTLKQKENGFVYLDVSNAFIDECIPLIELPGELRPLPTSSRSLGAHVSVLTEGEFTKYDLLQIAELGQEFSFTVTELRSFTVRGRDDIKRRWAFAVDAPELESLRERYGLSPLLKGYDFHITLGKQVPVATYPEKEQELIWSELDDASTPVQELSSVGDFTVVDAPEVLRVAERVDAVGRLCLKSNGFVYLDVDDAFIDRVVEHLPVQGEFSQNSTGGKKMGAHISVMYEDELIGNGIWELDEAFEFFSFEVKELRYFNVSKPGGKKKLWALAIDAPGLQRLRMKYGLKPKLKNHDFHITIGSESEVIVAPAA